MDISKIKYSDVTQALRGCTIPSGLQISLEQHPRKQTLDVQISIVHPLDPETKKYPPTTTLVRGYVNPDEPTKNLITYLALAIHLVLLGSSTRTCDFQPKVGGYGTGWTLVVGSR